MDYTNNHATGNPYPLPTHPGYGMNTGKENSSNNGCSGVRITVEQETIAEDNIASLSKAQIAQRKRREKERAKQK
ncbi:hypothetical protein AQUCO_01200039v1 [Aquilegia coerulea]|uniref:Uncharacterized protein n=1 Tax=Aquilegia coerulea TaxID=218851 RepID=A0A2G5E494_AQUCA|nr:hypothetical protein AQUCO_01200039v1 [Aquilegia coerulea]